MVFPNASTAVTEAVRHKNLPMVRWLIEQGADITIADKYGDRPYSVAVQNKNQEMADYLKALEPEDWHNEQEKARQLMPYKLPAKLVEYLKTGDVYKRQDLVVDRVNPGIVDLFTRQARKIVQEKEKGSVLQLSLIHISAILPNRYKRSMTKSRLKRNWQKKMPSKPSSRRW